MDLGQGDNGIFVGKTSYFISLIKNG